MRRCLLLLSFVVVMAQAAVARPLENEPIPNGFGVSVHGLGENFKDLEAVRAAGFRVVRRDLFWDVVERQKGVYDWAVTDRFVARMRQLGLRPLFILAYSNPLYAEKTSVLSNSGRMIQKVAAPATPEARQAFARYAAAAALRYKDSAPIWEIWNEPEQRGFWPPEPDVESYAALAEAACLAVRQVDPAATIVAPGASVTPKKPGDPVPFLKTLMMRGVSQCLDGVSVHPYLDANKLDTVPRFWKDVRAIVGKLTPVNSEWGLSTFSGKISDEFQASYLVRMMVLNAAAGVPVSIWYDWKDDGTDPNDAQHHFGVMRYDGTPKVAWTAMNVMTSLMSGQQFRCWAAGQNSGVTALVFERGDVWTLVVWGGVRPATQFVRLPQKGAAQALVTMQGQAQAAEVTESGLMMELDHRPVYISMKKPENGAAFCAAE